MAPTLVLFADPLNPLGWIAEPIRRQVAMTYPALEWEVRPAGMVETWDAYDGPELPGGRAAVPAICARLRETHRMPLDEFLWFEDAPESSWPACRAVAAAGLQGSAAALGLLRAFRESTFVRCEPVDDEATITTAMGRVPGLDAEAVAAALDDGTAEAAFAAARRAAAAVDAPGVSRADNRCALPTLVVRDGSEPLGVTGLDDFAAVADVVEAGAGVEPAGSPPDPEAVLERFSPEGWVTAAELAAITGRAPEDVVDDPSLEASGIVGSTFAGEPFWRLEADVAVADDAE